MPPRKRAKQFKRSFVGCWTCRRRKVKCDALRPHCERCSKSKLVCEGYDIKLNWSNPLTVKNGKIHSTGGEIDEESVVFKRSNIELCRWMLYTYVNELEDDLNFVDDATDNAAKGPFTVFRHKEQQRTPISLLPKPVLIAPASQTSKPLSPPQAPTPVAAEPSLPPLTRFRSSSPTKNDIEQPSILDQTYLIDHISHIQHFIELIPKIFSLSVKDAISSIVQTSVGALLLNNESPFDQSLLSSIIIISLLHTTKFTDSDKIEEIESLKSSIDSSLPRSLSSPNYTLLILLTILIDSSLGTYNPSLFHHKFIPPQTLEPLLDLYTFYQITNEFLNHSQYKMDDKFMPMYEDLDRAYNLLKNIQYLNKKSSHNNARISISLRDTPPDQIIRIPRYTEDDLDELPPPTFTVHFSNQSDSDEALEDENFDEEVQILNHETPQVLFQLDDSNDGKSTIMGISKHLLSLYYNLIQLLNHKKSFMENSQSPRNFPRLCSEFEDVLTRSIHYHIVDMKQKDEVFYDFLLFVFFKFVKNYPTSMLSYHLKKLKSNDLGLGIIKYISNLSDMTYNGLGRDTDQVIWGNDKIMREIIQRNTTKEDDDDLEFFFV